MALSPTVFLYVLCFLTSSYVSANLNKELFSNSNYEFIDLTHPFDNLTVYWPGVQRFEYTKKTEEYRDQSW